MANTTAFDIFGFMRDRGMSRIELLEGDQGHIFQLWYADGRLEELELTARSFTARELDLMEQQAQAEIEAESSQETDPGQEPPSPPPAADEKEKEAKKADG